MTFTSRILEILASAEMLADLQRCGDLMGLEGPRRDAYEAHARQKLDALRSIAVAMSDDEDEEDLIRSLASLWLELRFEWHRHNQIANYALFRTGESDGLEMAAGAFTSGMLVHVESLLDADILGRLNSEAAVLLDRTLQDLQGWQRQSVSVAA